MVYVSRPGWRGWLRGLPGALVLFLFMAFSLLPFAWMLTASLEPPSALYRATPSLLPHPFTWDNYQNLLHPLQQGVYFPRYFLNSLIVAGATVILALAVATPAAYGFSRFRFRGRQPILYAILLTSVFPLINFLIPLYIVMSRIGLLNTYPALVLGYLTFSLPLNIWLLKSFFDGIPPDMEISARLDGASRLRAFVEVALPAVVPGMVATAIYTFILAWDEYLYALTMISTATMRTLPVGLFAYFSEGVPDWSGLTATAIAMSIPVVLVFLTLQRYFITALTKGALKY
jgi:multiple sugar transport system permease protein